MSYAPSLFGDAPAQQSERNPGPPAAASYQIHSLLDLLYDGFFMLFLLKNNREPDAADNFLSRIQSFITNFDRCAKNLNASADDTIAAKFAFCAAVDEAVLSSPFKIRPQWERKPLQLTLFGEHLAGEKFFRYLEDARAQGSARLQSLEVFHMCLLLGFQGKYMMEGPEKLAYLTARVGDEIAQMKGKRAPFAPHWPLPDQISHRLRSEVPLWAVASVFALIGVLAFVGLNAYLKDSTLKAVAPYSEIVKLGPRSANLTLSLP
jgi:type VI secretion system protein ImpK